MAFENPAVPLLVPDVAEGELWSLRDDVHLQEEDTCVLLGSRWGTVRIPGPAPVLRQALRRMELGPARLENVPGTDDLACRVGLLVALRRLGGLVVRSVGAPDGHSPLLSVVPNTVDASLRPVPVPADVPLRLSRFAALRTEGDGWVLESPLSSFRAVFTRPEAGWLIASLGGPTTPKAAVERLPVSGPAALTVLSYLVATGMVQSATAAAEAEHAVLTGTDPRAGVNGAGPAGAGVNGAGTAGAGAYGAGTAGAGAYGAGELRFAEDDDPALRPWSHHDLMFHWRSRPGRNDGVFGATYPMSGLQDMPPAVKPLPAGPRTALPGPAAGAGGARELTLAEALERRTSVREHGSRPPTLDQLGELLHHGLRVRTAPDPHPGTPDGPVPARANRPYPSGGACYELEFYLSVQRCEGLEPGVYYYAPAEHCLVRLPTSEALRRGVLAEAQTGAGMAALPDILLTMTARFARVSWKYSGLAYALTLKHVGVVQQTLYLLTTALGLAGCAIGTGDTEQSARAFGLDWREESAVGEFTIGSLPDGG
ncbi:SagB family peptide dehydrogenase [Streptomyces sp. 5-8]|uniref:SagB family peptide dehydrogenase n=1 Tax=Streptomyces musisoli TaxID=2802280 RepID=A0ABS1P3A0_9ACTN|nr:MULTISPECIES: SagB family peptide dehydrogenase [Streptomyces]MBL1106835.1 SagB family peptide dehydrogenase [Streptomyces musisoli]MBY8842181.1 SagB family peptide dehydrogenase [Streptomyces sp. SP2-10]